MNLNDPFGRIASRRAREYESLRDAFKKAGINSREAAEEVLQKARRRAYKVIAFIVAVVVLVSLFRSDAGVIALALGGFILVWVYSVTRNGYAHIRRYIDEEIEAPASDDQGGD